MPEYKLDTTDREILSALQMDARTPFTEIAEKLGVSHGMIHQRVDRLRSSGVIRNMTIELDPEKLGYTIQTYIGVVLDRPGEYKAVIKRLQSHSELTEAYYTTGQYTFIMKVYSRSIQHLHQFLTEHVQKIPQVRSTETIVIMETALQRSLCVS